MHLPFRQIDRDAIDSARHVAHALGVPETQGMGMVLALHDWAITKAPDGDFSGIIRGTNSPRELVAIVLRWPVEDAERLWRALELMGFTQSADAPENTHERDRVRGLDRYTRAWQKNHRARGVPASGKKTAKDGAPYADAYAYAYADADAEKKGETPPARKRRGRPPRGTATARDAETAQTANGAGGETHANGATPAHDAQPGGADDGDALPEPGALLTVAPAPRAHPEQLQALWNELRAPTQPRWDELAGRRRKACAMRLLERPIDGPTGWRAVIERLAASPFCRGENDRGWVAGPDFLLRQDTATKALEGAYDERAPSIGNLARSKGPVRAEDVKHTGTTGEILDF